MAEHPAPVDSREKILEVAEALFARRGFAGVGLREVAEAAGLGKSSLFHHFKGKVQLYLAVVGRALERIEARVAPAFASGGPPAARLDRVIGTLVDTLAEHPASARLLLRALFEDDDFAPAPPEARAGERAIQTLVGRLEALLHEGVKAGDFRPVSSRHTVQTLVGATVYHFASGEFGEQLLGGSLFSEAEVRRRKDEITGLLHHGLAAPAAGSASGG